MDGGNTIHEMARVYLPKIGNMLKNNLSYLILFLFFGFVSCRTKNNAMPCDFNNLTVENNMIKLIFVDSTCTPIDKLRVILKIPHTEINIFHIKDTYPDCVYYTDTNGITTISVRKLLNIKFENKKNMFTKKDTIFGVVEKSPSISGFYFTPQNKLVVLKINETMGFYDPKCQVILKK
jgi:hypothetical protein